LSVHVVEPEDATVVVDGNEPVLVVGEARDRRPGERWDGDHPVDEHTAAAGQDELAPAYHRGPRRCAHMDAPAREQGLEGCGRGGAEELERVLFGRDQPYLSGTAMLAQVPCGHEGEFVERQRPHPLRGEGEGDRSHRSVHELVEQAAERSHVGATAEGQSSGQRLAGDSAGRHDQRVIGEALACPGHRTPLIRVNAGQAIGDQPTAPVLGDDLGQVVASRLAVLEGLGDGHRSIEEVALGREHGDVNPVPGQSPEREQRLDRRHATSRDYDMCALRVGHGGLLD
jgi:hypothetical protein